MKILHRKLPERIIRRLARHPLMVVSAATLGVKVSKDGFKLKKGEIDAPEFRMRTGGHLGAMGGGIAGAAAGAAAGSLVPGLGTILGAFAGSLVGEEVGNRAGRFTVGKVETTIFGGPAPSSPEKESSEKAVAEEAADTPSAPKRSL